MVSSMVLLGTSRIQGVALMAAVDEGCLEPPANLNIRLQDHVMLPPILQTEPPPFWCRGPRSTEVDIGDEDRGKKKKKKRKQTAPMGRRD